MGKIVKYEWKKQLFSKIVIGAVLLVLTLLYVIGTLAHKENWQEISLVFLIMAGVFSSMYVGIESLLVLNRDLRTKESHMLFMIPHSAYEILGAKILVAFCEILLTAVLFAAAFFLCFTAYVAANDGFARFLTVLQGLIRESIEVEITWQQAGIAAGMLFVSWIGVIAAGFVSIISVRTVLVKSRFATPIAVVVFLILNWGMGKISGVFLEHIPTLMQAFAIDTAVTAVITVLLLVLAGWMAEKKLSV